jgi:predicted MFS family arabinose efflux permease
MLLKLAVFASVFSALAIAFIFDKNSAILVQVFSNCAAIIAFLSLSEVFVRACPELIGGTFYACFVSVINLAATFGAIIGGWLYDQGFSFPLLAIGCLSSIPHSARNGREKTIKKQVQGGNSSVGKREKRNLKYEDEEETN